MLDRTLPKLHWTHAAHFSAALWLISWRPDIDPAHEIPAMIRAYNSATGTANTASSGYQTITQASLRAARDSLSRRSGEDSAEARRVWVEPDIQPLPF